MKHLSVQLISSHNLNFWKVWHFDGLVNVSSLGCEFTVHHRFQWVCNKQKRLMRVNCFTTKAADRNKLLTNFSVWQRLKWSCTMCDVDFNPLDKRGNKTSYWLDNDRVIQNILNKNQTFQPFWLMINISTVIGTYFSALNIFHFIFI